MGFCKHPSVLPLVDPIRAVSFHFRHNLKSGKPASSAALGQWQGQAKIPNAVRCCPHPNLIPAARAYRRLLFRISGLMVPAAVFGDALHLTHDAG